MGFTTYEKNGTTLPNATHTRMNLRDFFIECHSMHVSWACNAYRYNPPQLEFHRKLLGDPTGFLRQMCLYAMNGGKIDNTKGIISVWAMRLFALMSAVRWRHNPRVALSQRNHGSAGTSS
jgi:hypothetical protein